MIIITIMITVTMKTTMTTTTTTTTTTTDQSTMHSQQMSSRFPRSQYQGDGKCQGCGMWLEMTKSSQSVY